MSLVTLAMVDSRADTIFSGFIVLTLFKVLVVVWGGHQILQNLFYRLRITEMVKQGAK
jgi:hypothetical protein